MVNKTLTQKAFEYCKALALPHATTPRILTVADCNLRTDAMEQPAYDLEFGQIIRWLKEHGLILQSDLDGNSELSTRAERIGRKRRREAEQKHERQGA